MKCCLCAFLVPEKPDPVRRKANHPDVFYRDQVGYMKHAWCRNLSCPDGGEVVDVNVERKCKWAKNKEKPCQP